VLIFIQKQAYMKNLEKKVDLIIEQINKNDEEKKVTLVLTQSKAEKCSPSKVEEIRQLFNTNPRVKEIFKNSINNILREVFPDNYYTKGGYSEGEMSGIYDLEQPGRSVINKLNTNYSCFCVLLRDVNKVLLSQKQEPISFEKSDMFGQINKVKQFVNIIDEYKIRIFNTESSTFQSLMMVLGQTHAWGQKREDSTVEILKKQFGKDNVNAVGKLGSSDDMIGGVDCEITINGEVKTAQIKPFTHMKTEDGKTIVMGAGNVKKYKTDLLIFSKNNKEILVFDNHNSKIVNGDFVFPEENLIYTLS
jgi:hypothetical protein